MSENKKNLSKHRLETAKETMRSAEYNYEGKFYRDSINRAYYVVFYAIKAVLAIEGSDFKRHKDAIGLTNQQLGHGYDRGEEALKTYVGNMW